MRKTRLLFVGAFQELGYDDGPSVVPLRGKRTGPNKARLVEYLNSGKLMVGVPGLKPDAFDPKLRVSMHILTDGRFAWHKGLAQYVERYDVVLPDEFEAHVARNEFQIPAMIALDQLDLPEDL